jgi:hypothetical protein
MYLQDFAACTRSFTYLIGRVLLGSFQIKGVQAMTQIGVVIFRNPTNNNFFIFRLHHHNFLFV